MGARVWMGCLLTAAWMGWTAAAAAADGEVYSTLELEHREFPQESFAPDREPRASSVALSVEFFREWNRGDQLLSGLIFGRADSVDEERTHADIRELSFVHAARSYEARLGIRKVFWGVTESRHLVDIINQDDFVEDIDGEDKLGQPMINGAWITDYGTVDAFWLPYFRERTYPGEEGRPAAPLPIEEDAARYESSREQHHQDFALRWRHTIGSIDIGLSWFKGTARQPRLEPCVRQGSGFDGTENQANCDIPEAAPDQPMPTGFPPVDNALVALAQQTGQAPTDDQVKQQLVDALVLIPFYDQLEQVSLDAQWILGGWALKLEAARREQREVWTNAMVAGFEYTLFGVGGSAVDVGVLSEYLYDQRAGVFEAFFDRDVFAGTRISLNDVAGTTLLAGAIRDLDNTSVAYTVEAERRFGSSFKLALESRLLSNVPDDAPNKPLANEDSVSLIGQYFF